MVAMMTSRLKRLSRRRDMSCTKRVSLLRLVVAILGFVVVMHSNLLLSIRLNKYLPQSQSVRTMMHNNQSSSFLWRVERRQETSNHSSSTAKEVDPIMIFHRAVSGLGHRSMKMANAYHLSKALNLTRLSNGWGWECGGKKDNGDTMDIFYYLFGEDSISVPPPPRPILSPSLTDLIQNITDAAKQLNLTGPQSRRLINEIPGYDFMYPKDVLRLSSEVVQQKRQSDFELFTRLRSLFRDKDVALDFMDQHAYPNHFVFGLHVRAGNGEKGHFQKKSRELKIDLEQWIASFANMMLNYTSTKDYQQLSKGKPPLLFVATDSAKSIQLLQKYLSNTNTTFTATTNNTNTIPVIHFPQEHLKEGQGVSYRAKFQSPDQCYQAWSDQFMDMTLLSASDAVIAGQYSSFTQTIPLSIMIGNPDPNDDNNKWFCEVGSLGTVMECVNNYTSWLSIHLRNKPKTPEILIGNATAPRQYFEPRIDMPYYDLPTEVSGLAKLMGQECTQMVRLIPELVNTS